MNLNILLLILIAFTIIKVVDGYNKGMVKEIISFVIRDYFTITSQSCQEKNIIFLKKLNFLKSNIYQHFEA